MGSVGSMLALGILGWFAIQDIKKKNLSVIQMLTAFGIGLLVAVVSETDIINMLLGMVLGGSIYVVSCCTREQIGKGDAVVLMITGILLGGRENLELFFIALLLAAVYAGWLLIVRHAGRKQSFAFVPFLTMAQLIRLLLHLSGGAI